MPAPAAPDDGPFARGLLLRVVFSRRACFSASCISRSRSGRTRSSSSGDPASASANMDASPRGSILRVAVAVVVVVVAVVVVGVALEDAISAFFDCFLLRPPAVLPFSLFLSSPFLSFPWHRQNSVMVMVSVGRQGAAARGASSVRVEFRAANKA